MAAESGETPVPEGTQNAILAVQRFIASQRVHRMYPSNNPNVRASARKLCEVIQGFSSSRPLDLSFEREQISFAGRPLQPDHAEVNALARQFYLANVTGLLFEPDATEDEVLALLDALRAAEDEKIGFGEFQTWLRERGVARIQVREAGKVAVELATGAGAGSAWDTASLQRLEDLEREVFGGEHAGFRHAMRGVGEGQEAKTARLMGLLGQPVEFARLLLEVASQDRLQGRIDLDHQLATTLRLVSELEPMIQNVGPEDQLELYGKLAELVTVLQRSIQRELIDVSAPPWVQVAPVAQLFPDKIRNMTVKEALGLGLGPGVMSVLMASLRRVAAGDERLLAFLGGHEAPAPRPFEVRFDAYKPAPLAPAPPTPPRLGPTFFEPAPGDKPHPGEEALASATRNANGVVDSIAILRDLLVVEDELEAYRKLLAALVTRFRLCLASKTLGFAKEVLVALDGECTRNALPDLGNLEFLPPAREALASCGAPETMVVFNEVMTALPSGSQELNEAADLVRTIGDPAIESLMELLVQEESKAGRRKLLDLLVKVGKDHIERIASYGTHERWYVVRNTVWILGQIGPAAVPHILRCGSFPEVRVRREALRALAQAQGPDVGDLMMEYLLDADDFLVREAAARLVALRDPRAPAALGALAGKARFPERDPLTVAAVVRALGALGDARWLRLVEGLGSNKDPKGAFKVPEVKQACLEAAQALRSAAGAAPGGTGHGR